MTTTTEVKPFKEVTGINNNVFRVGDHVDVRADFSAGYNRPAGCGYVMDSVYSYVSVRYTPAHDSGRRHNKIPTSKFIPAILYQGMMVKVEKRNRENQNEIQNDEVEIDVDKRTIVEKLLALLITNNLRKQGWHCRDLRLDSKLEDQGVISSSIQLNEIKKTQLYAEAEVLRTYHALISGGKHKLKGRSSKFNKSIEKHNYQSLTYLLQQAWCKAWEEGIFILRRLQRDRIIMWDGR